MGVPRRRVHLAILIAASWLGTAGALLVVLELLSGPDLRWVGIGGVMLAAAAGVGFLVWRRLV